MTSCTDTKFVPTTDACFTTCSVCHQDSQGNIPTKCSTYMSNTMAREKCRQWALQGTNPSDISNGMQSYCDRNPGSKECNCIVPQPANIYNEIAKLVPVASKYCFWSACKDSTNYLVPPESDAQHCPDTVCVQIVSGDVKVEDVNQYSVCGGAKYNTTLMQFYEWMNENIGITPKQTQYTGLGIIIFCVVMIISSCMIVLVSD